MDIPFNLIFIMLDLLAASYENIGPLCDKMISLCFHKGVYLINAPVGTGKSFFFLDGPIFSLYKYSPRPIRNRRSSTGFTQLLFVLEEEVWLVHRILTRTKKGGDSVKSLLYRIQLSVDETCQILSTYETFFDVSLGELFKEHLQGVSCSSERELDALLSDLLPPKEVVLSAHFLMQDADNIFALPPGERLEILKHIFGFIGIDHAKEIIRDKRKEIQTTITVKEDMSDMTHDFQNILETIITSYNLLQVQHVLDTTLQLHIHNFLNQSFFQDLILLSKDIQIEGFVCDVDISFADILLSYIQNQKDFLTRINIKKEEVTKLQYSLQQDIVRITQEITHIEKEKKTFSSSEDINSLKELEQKQEKLNERLQEYITPHINRCRALGYTIDDIVDVVRLVDDLVAEGKQLQLQYTTNKQVYMTYTDQYQQSQKRKNDLTSQLSILQQSYDDQAVFHCDKIMGDCPYVTIIKKESLHALQQQQENLKQQLIGEEKIMLEKQEKLQQLEKTIHDSEITIDTHRSTLVNLKWKQVYVDYNLYQTTLKEIKNITAEIDIYYRQQQENLKQQQYVQTLATKQEMLEIQKKSYEQKQKECIKLLETYTQEVSVIDRESLQTIMQYIETLLTSIKTLQDILAQYTIRRHEIISLEGKEQQLKHLYTIFSKELLLLVLQDFLPTIQSTINSYLSEVAEYTLSFSLEQTASDTVNLEIYVEDNKGRRSVKSLSGGQKSLLKLAWIFSIATMLQLPFLFLDETITSLDAITTSHVADVLHRFVEHFTTKLYVITHASQIQDMPIWDKEIQVTFNESDGK